MDPINAYKLYISKLNPDIPALWQKPMTSPFLHYTDETWYERRVVGRDMLERFMKLSLSKSVNLQGEYTNHSIRATVISNLDKAGFEARHIMALSSHKNESTLKEYTVNCPESKMRDMFNTLSHAMQPKSKKQKVNHPPPNCN